MLHKILSDVMRDAELRSLQSAEESRAAAKAAELPWIRVEQALPQNDELKPYMLRRQFLVKLAPSKRLVVATFGYAGHDWWVGSFGQLLTPDYGYRVVGWCPLPYDMGDETLPDPTNPKPNPTPNLRKPTMEEVCCIS